MKIKKKIKHFKNMKRLVAILCYGKKSCHNICLALNSLRVEYRLVLPHEVPNFTPSHIILSGGPKHVYRKDRYILPKWVINNDIPVLGICYGMQIIAYTFGGLVEPKKDFEEGFIDVTEIIDNKQTIQKRWMYRKDNVISLPNNFKITGVTNEDDIASFTDDKKWWAVQYHPESQKCRDLKIFEKFLKLNNEPHSSKNMNFIDWKYGDILNYV